MGAAEEEAVLSRSTDKLSIVSEEVIGGGKSKSITK
jgi:hypothetical protein